MELSVRLTGIALKHQGTHDSLCAYYAAAMMLCALRPELEAAFDAAHVARDPLFGNLPRRGRQRVEDVVAAWLTSGVHLDRLTAALNRAGAPTRFRYAVMRRPPAFDALKAEVERGLPCVLAWESRTMGLHTVLVTGWERSRRGAPWLRVLDPSRVQDLLEHAQLERHAGRVELITCDDAHAGVRPDKLTVRRDRQGAIVQATVDRWDPGARRYRPIVG